MQIQTDEHLKEQKFHGSYDFPLLISRERITAYESDSFLWHLHPEIEMNIKLTDEQLAINNGYYYLYKGKCKFSKERLLGSHRQLTIGELCEKLLSPLQPYMSLMLN